MYCTLCKLSTTILPTFGVDNLFILNKKPMYERHGFLTTEKRSNYLEI